MNKQRSKYSVIDLFCGCGGLSKGFEMAGFDITLGVDFNQPALDTYAFNHKSSKALFGDLSKPETFNTIDSLLSGKQVDVVIGGPPCQGFSLTGPRNFDDERNKLYLAMIETVKRYHPKAFMIENVPGMANLYNGQVKDEIIRRFTKMGYSVSWKILCAADYGVPQIRKRLVFVGLLNTKEQFKFPEPYLKEDKYITCEEAISDLPPLDSDLGSEISNYTSEPLNSFQKTMRGNCDLLHNHVAVNHKDFVKEVISMVPDGGNYKDLPEGVGKLSLIHI